MFVNIRQKIKILNTAVITINTIKPHTMPIIL